MSTGGAGQRVAGIRAAQERGERRRRLIVAGSLVALLVVVIIVVVVAVVGKSPSSSPPFAAEGVRFFDVPSREHVYGRVHYAQTPPVGGDHSEVWLNCGFYESAVPEENAVHAMEHGAVWITHRPGLPQTQLTVLRQLAVDQSFVIVSPFDGLPSPVVTSAWGVQLQLDEATDPAVHEFVRAHRLGPQAPEVGSPCTGGAGLPTS